MVLDFACYADSYSYLAITIKGFAVTNVAEETGISIRKKEKLGLIGFGDCETLRRNQRKVSDTG